MNTRPLNTTESENLASINRAGISSILLFITQTGLEKAILDATEPVRILLHSQQIHNYEQQSQGVANKKKTESLIHTPDGIIALQTSLYRPTTKKGDPRIWFYGFRKYTSPNDVCAIFVHSEQIHLLNLSTSSLASDVNTGERNILTMFFTSLFQKSSAVSLELTKKLRELACNGPLEAVCTGDTAIGRSIETALGIQINSSKAPDYKGIELKSGRASLSGKETRATLFACVPDWSISQLKSSKDILERYGYQRETDFKLYCTVSSRTPNSQGLMFDFEEANRWLHEKHVASRINKVAVWRLSTLEQRLVNKHKETFWIKASAEKRKGREFFNLKSVLRTRNPNLAQLERMLKDGNVTMDHLIKRTPSGGAQEKGPLFKVTRSRIGELFLGEPAQYNLV